MRSAGEEHQSQLFWVETAMTRTVFAKFSVKRCAAPAALVRPGLVPELALGLVLALGLGLALAPAAGAQTSAPPMVPAYIPPPQLPPMDLIDQPTAHVLERDTYDLELHTFYAGGVVLRFRLGLTDAVQIGASYGGLGVLGQGAPDWHPRPELHFRARLLDETAGNPAWAIGFDSQGIGAWNGDLERYAFKARGIYTVLSKSYATLSGVGLHGGISYNPLEGGAQEDRPDLFLGLDAAINPQFTALAEYSLALNDDDPDEIPLRHAGRGYLNAGVAFEFAQGLSVQFLVRDMLRRTRAADWSRELVISYRRSR